jgi:hypothetical protein
MICNPFETGRALKSISQNPLIVVGHSRVLGSEADARASEPFYRLIAKDAFSMSRCGFKDFPHGQNDAEAP